MKQRTTTVATLLAATALCLAFMAQSASADWLVEGTPITKAEATEGEGELTLEDKTFGAAVSCNFIADGTVSPEEKDEVTEILNLSKGLASLSSPLTLASGACKVLRGCSTSSSVEVAPEKLPWKFQAKGAESSEVSILNNGSLDLSVTCTILGIKATDECTGETSSKLEGVENGLLAPVESAKLNCSVGGTGAGALTIYWFLLELAKKLAILICWETLVLKGEWATSAECLSSKGAGGNLPAPSWLNIQV